MKTALIIYILLSIPASVSLPLTTQSIESDQVRFNGILELSDGKIVASYVVKKVVEGSESVLGFDYTYETHVVRLDKKWENDESFGTKGKVVVKREMINPVELNGQIFSAYYEEGSVGVIAIDKKGNVSEIGKNQLIQRYKKDKWDQEGEELELLKAFKFSEEEIIIIGNWNFKKDIWRKDPVLLKINLQGEVVKHFGNNGVSRISIPKTQDNTEDWITSCEVKNKQICIAGGTDERTGFVILYNEQGMPVEGFGDKGILLEKAGRDQFFGGYRYPDLNFFSAYGPDSSIYLLARKSIYEGLKNTDIDIQKIKSNSKLETLKTNIDLRAFKNHIAVYPCNPVLVNNSHFIVGISTGNPYHENGIISILLDGTLDKSFGDKGVKIYDNNLFGNEDYFFNHTAFLKNKQIVIEVTKNVHTLKREYEYNSKIGILILTQDGLPNTKVSKNGLKWLYTAN